MLKEIALKNHKLEIIKIIKSGPVSEISICNFNDIKSIIRIDYPSANKIKVDRENEIFILEHLRFLKSTPEILFRRSFEWNISMALYRGLRIFIKGQP